MTIRNPDVSYDQSLAQVLKLVCQVVLSKTRTAVPGVVISYRASPRPVADVQPATDMMLADGETMPRAPVLNVPVWWPTFGGYSIIGSLSKGDGVLLVYCERDLTNFLQTGRAGPLATGRVMSEQDVVALPWNHTPDDPPAAGLTIRADDGSAEIAIESGGRVTVDGDRISLVGPVSVTGSLRVNGTAVALQGHSH